MFNSSDGDVVGETQEESAQKSPRLGARFVYAAYAVCITPFAYVSFIFIGHRAQGTGHRVELPILHQNSYYRFFIGQIT